MKFDKTRIVAVLGAAAVIATVGGVSGAAADRLLTGKDIKNNTIGSVDIKRHSLGGWDIRTGALGPRVLSDRTKAMIAENGEKGETGDPGVDGVSQYVAAAPGPNTYVVGTESITVDCPGDRYALSGGIMHWGKVGPAPVIHESYPVSALIDGKYVATGWNFTVTGGADEANRTGIAPWVVCAAIN